MAERREWYENISTDDLITRLLDYKVRDLINFCDPSAPSSYVCKRALDKIVNGQYIPNNISYRNVESPVGMRRNLQPRRESRSYSSINQRLPMIPNINTSVLPRVPPLLSSENASRINTTNIPTGQAYSRSISTIPISTEYYGEYY